MASPGHDDAGADNYGCHPYHMANAENCLRTVSQSRCGILDHRQRLLDDRGIFRIRRRATNLYHHTILYRTLFYRHILRLHFTWEKRNSTTVNRYQAAALLELRITIGSCLNNRVIAW